MLRFTFSNVRNSLDNKSVRMVFALGHATVSGSACICTSARYVPNHRQVVDTLASFLNPNSTVGCGKLNKWWTKSVEPTMILPYFKTSSRGVMYGRFSLQA